MNSLLNSIHSQKEFWNAMKNISFRRKQPKNNIDSHTWFLHFRNLLEKNSNDDDTQEDLHDTQTDAYFNRPICKEEIIYALRKIKNHKAAGPDGIIGEMYKYANDYVIQLLEKLFNNIFDTGRFPQSWTESIVLPLFKKGNTSDPNNYRGISISNICSKIFSTIINNRIQEWVQNNNITGEHQAGFKKGYSTIDHMFTLLALIQKQFARNHKLYVAFIDFEKAFDSINRHILWPILSKNGIKGKLYNCIRSMYHSVKCQIRNGAKFTDLINCTADVKQGDACSPVLFTLFINELAVEVIENGRHGATFSCDPFQLFILLLADDIVLVSETVVGLQNQLNNLQRASRKLQLKVNMDKSNIIVFRKGGYLSSKEIWFYDEAKMPVVNAYRYLGINFTTRLSFVPACKESSSRAKNALINVMRKLSIVKNTSLKLFLKIYDAQIQPIAQYGAEIWGLSKAAVHCESVHLLALKKFLGVSMQTPNDFVYSETSRYPMYIHFAVQCVRYWLRLVQMNECRLPQKAYKMLFDLDSKGKNNWVTDVRMCLCKHGFGNVWLYQGVGNESVFIKLF